MYSELQYMKDENGNNCAYVVLIDGIKSVVPFDANNTDYGQIQDMIESGELVVAPAEG